MLTYAAIHVRILIHFGKWVIVLPWAVPATKISLTFVKKVKNNCCLKLLLLVVLFAPPPPPLLTLSLSLSLQFPVSKF